MAYDPFIPVLASGTPVLQATTEQKKYIKDILALACSDSFFAEKAYKAILLTLLAGALEGGSGPTPPPDVLPVVTSLVPNTIAVGAPDFTLHVHGSAFVPTSQIFIKGVVAPTIYVSPTELTTTIDMALVVTPGMAPVTVRSGALESTPIDFAVTL